MRRAFLKTHPDINSSVRELLESGQVEASLEEETVLRAAAVAEVEANERKRMRLQDEEAEEAARQRAQVAERRRNEQQEQRRRELEENVHVVESRDPTGSTIGCKDAVTLQAALEYERVGDGYNFTRLAGGLTGPCHILSKGTTVIPLVQQSEYWLVNLGFWSFWVPAKDLKKRR
jgi:hypothetical protein